MKMTQHQIFIASLKKQLSSNTECDEIDLDNRSVHSDAVCKEDLMKEIEREFDELFGDIDDG